MSEQKLSDAWQCQSCGCYFPHIPKVLDDDVKRCSKCVEVEILEAKLEAMKKANLIARIALGRVEKCASKHAREATQALVAAQKE